MQVKTYYLWDTHQLNGIGLLVHTDSDIGTVVSFLVKLISTTLNKNEKS